MTSSVEIIPRELEPPQRQAADTLDRHVSVSAGPGAGKTMVLVERYLHILRTCDVSVDQIVAITFTNRAANEMRERMRKELDALLSAAPPEQRSRWMRHKRTLDGAVITTIHGFCARILRDFPVEADLDPQFLLLEAHRSAMLEEAVAEETITRFISDQHPALTELAAGVGRARLARGLIDLYRAIRNQGLTLDGLAELTAGCHGSLNDFNTAVEELTASMREYLQASGLTPAAAAKRRDARERWPRLLELLKAAPDSHSLAEVIEAIGEFREVARPSLSANVRELVARLDKLIWEKNLRGRVPGALLDLHAARYANELIMAAAQIERRLDEQKRLQSALDFDDLQVRTLRLLEARPEVMRRISGRYRFFLVDEFQDTNGLQRDLMARLALGVDPGLGTDHKPSAVGSANLFIVGDRKQSIYGFRGADVDVFREMTSRIEACGGISIPLNRNFRSQRPLVNFCNYLFQRIFEAEGTLGAADLNELGYVDHEDGIAVREDEDVPPTVEFLIDLRPSSTSCQLVDDGNRATDESGGGDGSTSCQPIDDGSTSRRLINQQNWAQEKPRERDAAQLASRIVSIVGTESISDRKRGLRTLEYRDIALLFRAMTEVHIYESALRRAGIPYITVQGKGFYAREEITDFIQLLRFLDNKTDEVALAAVLRSPICGLSDETLLALRCAPLRGLPGDRALISRSATRPLFEALRDQQQVEFVDSAERQAIDDARVLLEDLILRSKRCRISELLRLSVERSGYRTIAAATFNGAQRLANLEKLFTLAERFEHSGAHLIRDFVRFVQDFEEAGGRESEGQIDESANAVRIMSIHQSKGLEFPVVIIPDLHRQPDQFRDWWALDRHRGLTAKVPNGRGGLAAGSAFTTFAERAKLREQFESMRLLYVAATRAENRLILSGAAKQLGGTRSSWLSWISRTLGIGNDSVSGLLNPAEGVQFQLTLNLLDTIGAQARPEESTIRGAEPPPQPGNESFPLLEAIKTEPSAAIHRFSVTQLLNYQRCPRQYYFDRVLHVPGEEELEVWNDAEAPEPPSNLTATLRGAVIHRFCEAHRQGDDTLGLLKTCVEATLQQRAAELAERVLEIDVDTALRDLLPLAENYVASKVRRRIESIRRPADPDPSVTHSLPLGVLSEQRFRLRRPLGILTGTIDKLLVSPSSEENGLDVEIIDFKTNRFRGRGARGEADHDRRKVAPNSREQLSFGFLEPVSSAGSSDDLLIRTEIQAAASDYQIQMQAYALAARELIPEAQSVRVTLHFLDPDVEVHLPDDLLDREACARAIDETMSSIVTSSAPGSFPVRPAEHCRMCRFVELCPPGGRWLHAR